MYLVLFNHHCSWLLFFKPLYIIVQRRNKGLTLKIVLPSWAGDMLTTTPADWRAAIFSLAPPFPPAMMAPAWPILRPGGAVSPAMKDTTGFELAPWTWEREKKNMTVKWGGNGQNRRISSRERVRMWVQLADQQSGGRKGAKRGRGVYKNREN